ncbi:MAG: methylated-DNA--[protein]-cysteine S-methyltransferase [Coriobacteriia bacterium]|nr:methylated-DNA--[protein]-cysteine S-methyltransferase [Coriobacteriia bacterium]
MNANAAETIHYTVADTSLGTMLAAASDRGVCFVAFDDSADALVAEAARRFPGAAIEPSGDLDPAWITEVVDRVEAPGSAHATELPLDLRGTPFRKQVWEALQAIPPGETQTYGQIAAKIGRPTAVRAVAGACGANPVAVLVPCHRVIGADGTLTGYRWGVERKRALLERERQ